jgi:hypothetical protein
MLGSTLDSDPEKPSIDELIPLSQAAKISEFSSSASRIALMS